MKKDEKMNMNGSIAGHDTGALFDYIQTLYPLPGDIAAYIAEHIFYKKLRRGKYLLKPGEVCNHYYYIQKGILRSYIKYGTKEITTWINPENEITTSIRSISKREPSREYIQALTDCELVCMHADAVREIYQRFPDLNRLARIILEEYYAGAEERAFICRIPNAKTRYKHFMESRPELVNRLPLKYIASYLGMTVETLSRLRSNKKNKLL